MQKKTRIFLSAFFIALIPLLFSSCDEMMTRAEREIVGEYVSDDGTCRVTFHSNLQGWWEYSDGRRFSFDWEATDSRLYIRTYDFNGWYYYNLSVAGTLILYDFDQYGSLVLLRRRGGGYNSW